MSLHDVTEVFQVNFVVVGVELGLQRCESVPLAFMSWPAVVEKDHFIKLERQEACSCSFTDRLRLRSSFVRAGVSYIVLVFAFFHLDRLYVNMLKTMGFPLHQPGAPIDSASYILLVGVGAPFK